MDNSSRKVLRPTRPHKGKQLYSLKDLKKAKEQEFSDNFHLGFHSPYPSPRSSLWLKAALWFGSFFLLLLLTVASGLIYLTSPWGEEHLTEIVEESVNHFGESMDLRISIGSLGDLWDGKIHIVNLRVYDTYGPWLRISEGTLHPDWVSLLRSIVASWRYTRNKSIPDTFFRHNTPISSLSDKRNKTHQSDMENLPFTIEQEEKAWQEMQTTSKAQNPNTTEEHTRKNLQTNRNHDAFVHNLLSAKDILNNKVVLGLRTGTLINIIMPRLPQYEHSTSSAPIDPQNLFDFLPPWLALDVGELELADFQLGSDARSINFSTRIHGQISEERLLLRTTLLAAKNISSQWVLPGIHELPEDVKLSLSEMNNFLQSDSRNPQAKYGPLLKTRRILGFLTLDYDQGDIDLRWQMQDSLLLPLLFNGVDILWTRSRILAQISAWPPTPEEPLQARFVSRYGLRLVQDDQIIPTSSSSGQIFWDSNKLVFRDMSIQSPLKEPNFSLKASLGYSPQKGFGSQFNLAIKDITPLATVLGIDTKEFPIGGAVTLDSYVSQGGDLLFWWRKPLPPIQGHRYLPGYYANPYDGSILAKSILRYINKTLTLADKLANAKTTQNDTVVKNNATNTTNTGTQATNDKGQKEQGEQNRQAVKNSKNMPPSHALRTPRHLHATQQTASQLQTPQQQAKQGQGNSPYAPTYLGPMPTPSQGIDGLFYSFKFESPLLQVPKGHIKDVFFSINGTSAHAASTPEGQRFYDQHKLDDHEQSTLSDFSKDGLPRGILGKVFLRFGDIFQQGTGILTGQMFAGGAYPGAKSFQLRLHDMEAKFPGLSGDGDLAFAYALPIVKRRWPWIDGDLNISIDDWDFISSLYDAPVRAKQAQLYSTYKSVLDKNGKPLQTFQAQLTTDRLDSKDFMVRRAFAKAESRHVHSLADTVTLSFGSSREALARKQHYTPEAHVPIFIATVELASGRGGPVRWNLGRGDVDITGEKANFTLHMAGELNALLEGLFNFRTRALSLKEIVLNTKPSTTSQRTTQKKTVP